MTTENKFKDYIFFDCEVFKHDVFVVFSDYEMKKFTVFHNDWTGLAEHIQGKTLVSYNGYHYDDAIVHAMLAGNSPEQIKHLNDRIISGEKVKVKNYKYESIDLFQQLLGFPSLKKIEANLGKMILESSVSFDIDRKLTQEELKDSIHYCAYDTKMLKEVWDLRYGDYVVPKREIVKMLDNPNAARWNNTTISANILTKKPLVKWSNIRVDDEILEIAPPDVVDMWLTKDKGTITKHEFDNDITWAFGGIHSQNVKKKYFENVVLLDVALR